MKTIGIYLGTNDETQFSIEKRKQAYNILEQTFHHHQIHITYYSMASLNQKDGHYKKYGSQWHEKRLKKGFENIDALGFCANPADSNAPGYDWYAKADIGWGLCSSVSVFMPTEYCEIHSLSFNEMIRSLVSLHEWDYGWAIIRDRDKAIEAYTCGDGIEQGMTKHDEELLDLWYKTSYSETEKRKSHLRDIYPINILTSKHLSFPILGETLRDFIQGNKNSELTPLSDNLWIWKIKTEHLPKIRKATQKSGLLISRPNTDKPSIFEKIRDLRL